MKKKDKKWMWLLAIPILAIFFIPGLKESLASVIGETQTCNTAPFDPNCFCPTGYEKEPIKFSSVSYLWSGSLKFGCIPELPSSDCSYPIEVIAFDEVYKAKALACAKEYFYLNTPDCPTIECEEPLWNVYAIVSEYTVTQDVQLPPTHIFVECRNGGPVWRAVLNIENGLPHSTFETYCSASGK